VASGVLTDLTSYVNSDKAFQADRNAIAPIFWKGAKPGPVGGSGAILGGIPYVTQPNSMFFVNLDLMKKYGVSPSWNKTYESITKAGVQMTKDGNYGISLRSNGLVNFGH